MSCLCLSLKQTKQYFGEKKYLLAFLCTLLETRLLVAHSVISMNSSSVFFLKSEIASLNFKIWHRAISTPETPMPPKRPTTSIQPGSQTYHFPCHSDRLPCQTFHCPPGTLTRTPAHGPRGSISALPGAPLLAPETIRAQQVWSCTGRERVPTAWVGQCPPQEGCSLLFLNGDNTYHCLQYPSPHLYLPSQP